MIEFKVIYLLVPPPGWVKSTQSLLFLCEVGLVAALLHRKGVELHQPPLPPVGSIQRHLSVCLICTRNSCCAVLLLRVRKPP